MTIDCSMCGVGLPQHHYECPRLTVVSTEKKPSCGKSCNCPSYREHLMSISVSSAATPSRDRSAETAAALEREKRWDKDMPAYRRLRKEGLQPKHIDGSAEIESGARDRIEVEDGVSYGKTLPVIKELREAVAESKAS